VLQQASLCKSQTSALRLAVLRVEVLNWHDSAVVARRQLGHRLLAVYFCPRSASV